MSLCFASLCKTFPSTLGGLIWNAPCNTLIPTHFLWVMANHNSSLFMTPIPCTSSLSRLQVCFHFAFFQANYFLCPKLNAFHVLSQGFINHSLQQEPASNHSRPLHKPDFSPTLRSSRFVQTLEADKIRWIEQTLGHWFWKLGRILSTPVHIFCYWGFVKLNMSIKVYASFLLGKTVTSRQFHLG